MIPTQLEAIEHVHEGETHVKHPPSTIRKADPDRRYYASARLRFRWEDGFIYRRTFVAYGNHPSVALRRLYVTISAHVT